LAQEEPVERLLDRLGSERVEERDRAEAQLLERRAEVRAALERAASSADVEVAARARRVLGRVEAADEGDVRARWVGAFAGLRRGAPRAEVEREVARLRNPGGRLPDRSWGHGDRADHEAYGLDGTWQLYAVFEEEPPRALRSHEVIGFPDLRPEIDPELYRAVRLVHEAPKLKGYDFDPRRLLRSAAGLHPLGAEGVLRACEAYERLVNARTGDEDIEIVRAAYKRATRYDLEEQRIFLVLRALFIRKDGTEGVPPARVGDPGVPVDAAHAAFPLFPLAIEGGVPFFLTGGYMLFGKAESPLERVAEVRKAHVLRPRPPVPSILPTEAADRLTSSKEWIRVFGEKRPHFSAGLVRAQALRALSSVYEAKHGTCGTDSHAGLHHDADWREDAQAAARLRSRWDPVRGDFVSGP
jgi:hypothetical protein